MTLSRLRFHLTRSSGNRKTGPIPVTTSSRATCSPSCPFLLNGCYADGGGPLRLHWEKVTTGERGVSFAVNKDQDEAERLEDWSRWVD
jgi:hypothetical protein